MNDITKIIGVGMLVIIVGIIIMFAGMVWSILKSSSGKVEGGGVIIIGPIPIVFGTSKEITKILLVLAIILTALAMTMYLLLSKSSIKP